MRKLLFAVVLLAVAGYYAPPFFASRGAAKLRHLPGKTSDGHAQLELACDACHTPFGGVNNAACTHCHGAALTAAEDSHPESKFSDPRNAEKLAALDARQCSTCHQEHVAARTSRGGVTLEAGFCVKCHAGVGDERPDHAGLAATTCTNTGCHNFHDNRATNEDFLAKHLEEPRLAARPQPAAAPARSHAGAGVACATCHVGGDGVFQLKPAADCVRCHAAEGGRWNEGKHGMRPAIGLPAMVTDDARRPMAAHGRTLGCQSCHDAHEADPGHAAVAACVGCHADGHSKAFFASPHAKAGVTCATCHLPGGEHDQNANLRPTTKMVRTVCAGCHGVGFALDALADPALVARNFDTEPATHVASMDMVRARVRAHEAAKQKKEDTR